MIAIVDYGAGNLRSVQNTLGEIGADYTLVRDAAGLRAASKIILPGVGHFETLIRVLDEFKLRAPLVDAIRGGVPFLGICLGLQTLYDGSDEAPEVTGLRLSSRITSPPVNPASSAGLPGCTCATATPCTSEPRFSC